MSNKSLSIVIPAYNEEQNIEATLGEVLMACRSIPMTFEVIVVNDCSRDQTQKVTEAIAAKNPEVRLMTNTENQGFGASYWNGVRAARMDCVMMMVADDAIGRDSMVEIIKLKDLAQVVIPFIANPEERSTVRQLLSWGYVRIINFIFGFNLRYYNGHNIVETQLLKEMPNTSGFAYAAQYVVRLLSQGCTFVEVPMFIKNRAVGETKAFKLKNILSVFKTIALLIKEVYVDRQWTSKKVKI